MTPDGTGRRAGPQKARARRSGSGLDTAAASGSGPRRSATRPTESSESGVGARSGGARQTSAKRRASGRQRSLDSQGRRALFETPVSAARDAIRSGNPRDGKAALYSTGPRQAGTVVVTCSSCEARSRINLTDLGLRWLSGSVWLPGRRNGHWMRCPSCTNRAWCSVAWND